MSNIKVTSYNLNYNHTIVLFGSIVLAAWGGGITFVSLENPCYGNLHGNCISSIVIKLYAIIIIFILIRKLNILLYNALVSSFNILGKVVNFSCFMNIL